METYIKQMLKCAVCYVPFWFFLTQINSFAAMVSLYIPAYWCFVYFPAMLHNSTVGITVVLLAGLFFESQFEVFHGYFLPLSVVIFALLRYRKDRGGEMKPAAHFWLATLVHWLLVIVPSLYLQLFSSTHYGSIHLWKKTFVDGLAGQVFLVFTLLAVMALIAIFQDRSSRKDRTVSVQRW